MLGRMWDAATRWTMVYHQPIFELCLGGSAVPRTMSPTDAQKVELFRDSAYYEIIHTFGVPAEFTADHLDSHAIGETINFSRRVHARALSHFLFRRPSDQGVPDKDDAFAEDFGFDTTALGLTDDARKRKAENIDLNKGLIHITYGRVTGATNKPWTNPVLTELLPVTIQFMRHIRDNERRILPGGRELFVDEQERRGWKELLSCLERCQGGMERLRFLSGFRGHQTWYFPSTEPGRIDALYGAKEKTAPGDAVLLSTATNTTATSTGGSIGLRGSARPFGPT
jgi:hypothetical protein